MTTSSITVPDIPVRECTPWCDGSRDGHRDMHPDDRSCWSEYHVVPLDRHEPTDIPSTLNVLLRRFPGENQATVGIHVEEIDHEIWLTPAEAHLLREHLTRLLEISEANR